jgi:hypothetical protein
MPAACVFLSCAAAVEPMGVTHSAWEWAGLPHPVREMIHARAELVPPYGHEDPKLLDPRQWPESTDFVGRRFVLNVGASQGDVASTHKSVKTVRPGWSFSLVYSNEWKGWRSGTLAVGPSYHWNEFGRLDRRTWFEPDTVRFRSKQYVTYPSGALLKYSVGERAQDMEHPDSLTMFTEYFDRHGRLLGVEYVVRRGGRVSRELSWWQGRPVSGAMWGQAVNQLFRTVSEKEKKRRK